MRFFLLLLAGLPAAARSTVELPTVAVVTVQGVEAYEQTVAGIRERLPDVQVWDARDSVRLRENLKKPPAVAIAIGSSAAAALESAATAQTPLIATVVLECDLEDAAISSRLRSAITVDVPADVLLGEIQRLFPGKNRIGLIRGPMQTENYMRSVEASARRLGLNMQVATCPEARLLVEMFLKLKGHVDVVWCPPNAQLYTSATVKPLLIASLTNRLPIIGFSEQFAQAGALFGGSADFVELGRQTAALAIRVARNEPVPARQAARKFHFAYNQRVARILGVKADVEERPGELLIIR